jgi:uncharacterized protein (TIGR03083 family)
MDCFRGEIGVQSSGVRANLAQPLGCPRRALASGATLARMEYWAEIERERRDLVDQVESLTEEQRRTPRLCGTWTVRDVLAHLLSPLTPSVTRRFALAMVKARGNFDRANQLLAASQARLSPPELLAGLRQHAASRFHPPGLNSQAPLTDVLVHGLDIRIPLGFDPDRPADAWRSSLTFLCGSEARKGFIGRPLPSLNLSATDVDFSAAVGGGADAVVGPAPRWRWRLWAAPSGSTISTVQEPWS